MKTMRHAWIAGLLIAVAVPALGHGNEHPAHRRAAESQPAPAASPRVEAAPAVTTAAVTTHRFADTEVAAIDAAFASAVGNGATPQGVRTPAEKAVWLARHRDARRILSANPTATYAIARNPEAAKELARHRDLRAILRGNRAAAEALVANDDAAHTFAAHADASRIAADHPSIRPTLDRHRAHRSGSSSGSGSSGAPYACPMHPNVTSASPGRCPECGMDLVRRGSSSQSGHQHAH